METFLCFKLCVHTILFLYSSLIFGWQSVFRTQMRSPEECSEAPPMSRSDLSFLRRKIKLFISPFYFKRKGLAGVDLNPIIWLEMYLDSTTGPSSAPQGH